MPNTYPDSWLTKEGYIERMQHIENEFERILLEKVELKAAYIARNCDFKVGEKVCVLHPFSHEAVDEAYVREIAVTQEGGFLYRCYRAERKGNKSHAAYLYPEEWGYDWIKIAKLEDFPMEDDFEFDETYRL